MVQAIFDKKSNIYTVRFNNGKELILDGSYEVEPFKKNDLNIKNVIIKKIKEDIL